MARILFGASMNIRLHESFTGVFERSLTRVLMTGAGYRL